ncbi:hypothetical protein GDO81_023572 [Engystomops pustulosus]|uniref:Maturase K n=1 Tax=Engystomops pustulosus TaxID=76066 RepID=A0AAV6YLV5_ENGPU|nr:hypothetical protein GDO81_023572 [Engystomops pustulosus]
MRSGDELFGILFSFEKIIQLGSEEEIIFFGIEELHLIMERSEETIFLEFWRTSYNYGMNRKRNNDFYILRVIHELWPLF